MGLRVKVRTAINYMIAKARQSGTCMNRMIIENMIIKFPYNARPDWLKQRTLADNKGQVNDISCLSNLCFGISTNLSQNKHPICDSDKINLNELVVSSKYGS